MEKEKFIPTRPELVEYFDWKQERNREILIFMEETKIWQEILDDCHEKSGPYKIQACQELREIVDERMKYYHSNFSHPNMPKMTAGIPYTFESLPK